MKIASLILPNADNAGTPLHDVHACLRADLQDNFGGFTALPSSGGWLDARGVVVAETGTLYFIAMLDDAENERKLRSIARHVCKLASQDCVMIATAAGVVEFIDARAFVADARAVAIKAEHDAKAPERKRLSNAMARRAESFNRQECKDWTAGLSRVEG